MPIPIKSRASKESGHFLCLGFLFALVSVVSAVVACFGAFGPKVIAEWADVGSAIGGLNQGYSMTGVSVSHPNDPNHLDPVADWTGSGYVDQQDFCDQSTTCGVRVCEAPIPEAP